MKAAKSSGRGVCLEGECALMSLLVVISYGLQPLNKMALINESIDEAISD